MIRALMILPLLALAACGGNTMLEPLVRTVEVRVPVPVPCPADVGEAPDYPDSDAAISEAARRGLFPVAQLYKAGRLLRMAREEQLTLALEACTKISEEKKTDTAPGT